MIHRNHLSSNARLRARLLSVVSIGLSLCALALHASPALAQGTLTRVEQDDPSVSYSGNWYANSSGAHSGSGAALTNTRGARATVSFTGTGITWFGVTDGWSGLANVYLDGTMQVVNTFGPGGYQQALFRAAGLVSGPHTLSIEVTHERGAQTEGSWVWIDAFQIENGTTLPGGVTAIAGRVEESHPALVYSGRWFSNANPAHSGGASAMAMDAGASVSVTFNGTGISWVAYRDEWSGVARIFVDGQLRTTIDNYISPSQVRAVPFSIGELGMGVHTLTIEATGSRNASSKASWIWLDAFDVVK